MKKINLNRLRQSDSDKYFRKNCMLLQKCKKKNADRNFLRKRNISGWRFSHSHVIQFLKPALPAGLIYPPLAKVHLLFLNGRHPCPLYVPIRVSIQQYSLSCFRFPSHLRFTAPQFIPGRTISLFFIPPHSPIKKHFFSNKSAFFHNSALFHQNTYGLIKHLTSPGQRIIFIYPWAINSPITSRIISSSSSDSICENLFSPDAALSRIPRSALSTS